LSSGADVSPAVVSAIVREILSQLQPAVDAAVRNSLGAGTGSGRGGGPRYALRRGHGAWEVIFDWERAVVGDELGLWYADHLLRVQPWQLIHAVPLAAAALGRPALQEGDLESASKETVQLLQAEARECQTVLEDPNAPDEQKAKAREKLEALAEARREVDRKPRSGAGKCVEAVRKALWRLHDDYADARDCEGRPDRVLRRFAKHLKEHLLIPSSRYSRRRNGRQRAGVAGCFIYERPPGVVWED
jgi:hypothetical protein